MRYALFGLSLLGCHPVAIEAPTPLHEPVTVTLVAMNDFHGAIYEKPVEGHPDQALGGLPWLVGAVKHLREVEPDLLLLDGGDSFQGDWPVNATEGAGAVEAFQLLGVDATAVGNHEFDYGAGSATSHPLRGALEDAARSRTQWLAANIWEIDSDGKRVSPWVPAGMERWRMFERKGAKIAVIGLSTTDTPMTTLAQNVAGIAFGDPVEAVRELLPEISAAGAHAVVVVGHLTGKCHPPGPFDPEPNCIPDGEIGRLLTELPPGTIDVLIVGHAHTLLANRVGDTFVLENRNQGQALGQLDLVIGPDGVHPDASTLHAPWPMLHEPVDPGCTGSPYPPEARDLGGIRIAPDAASVRLVHELEGRAGGSLCEVVGCSTTFLGRTRTEESAVGDLVSTAMLEAFPDADMALQNSGGLRGDLPNGELRKEHIFGVMPFDNRLVLLDMSGAQILQAMRIGSSGAHGILQVAGVHYRFDPARSTGIDMDGDGSVAEWERDRLCAVWSDQGPLDLNAHYRVATTDFLLAGGDHLGPGFAGATVAAKGPLLRDAILAYVRSQKECLGSDHPILDAAHPRIELGPCK